MGLTSCLTAQTSGLHWSGLGVKVSRIRDSPLFSPYQWLCLESHTCTHTHAQTHAQTHTLPAEPNTSSNPSLCSMRTESITMGWDQSQTKSALAVKRRADKPRSPVHKVQHKNRTSIQRIKGMDGETTIN